MSSLIFLAIVAIWAAYLLQHWVRRREDAAATRSVDGFTDAMRVLEKKPASAQAEARGSHPESYAAEPARDARPAIAAAGAVAARTSRRHSPLVARRATEHLGAGAAPNVAPVGDRAPTDDFAPADLAPHPAEVHSMAELHADQTSHDRRDGRRPPRRQEPVAPQPRVSMAQRRLRAMLLLVALLWVPVSVWLAFTGVLLWASVPFSVVTVLAVLVWLRAEARADRPHASSGSGGRRRGPRADSRTTQARVAESSDDAFAEEVHVDVEQVILSSEITQVIHHSTVTQVRPDQVAVSANDSVFDIQAVATGPVPVVQTPAEELPPGSWSPVPVPKPTYVLKAKAEPRYTESGIPADVFDTPEFAEEAEELDERARFARRAASQ